MKKTAGSVSLLVLCGLLSGCWNRVELNELSIVSASAFDLEGDDWVNSYQVVIPSAISSGMGMTGGASSTSPVSVFSSRGRTIREAVSRSTSETPRNLFFAHNNVVIISDAVARRGLNQILDLHYRNPDARETVSMLIAKGSARSILEYLIHTEKIPGQGIREIINNEAKQSSMVPSVMLYELAMAVTGSAKSALIPEILISGEPQPDGKSLDTLKKTFQPSKLRMGKLAVLREDKLAGWLTREEGLGVTFITNKMKSGVLPFSCKKTDGQAYNSSLRVDTSSTKLNPDKESGRFIMNVDIRSEGHLLESGCALDLSNPEVIKQLEQQLQNEIAQIVEKSWQAVKKLDVDVLGFAEAIHRKYPKDWKKLNKDWAAEFAKVELKPHITVSMNRVGLSNKTFSNPQKDNKE